MNSKPWQLLALPLLAVVLALLAVLYMLVQPFAVRSGESLSFTVGASQVEVVFHGEVSSESLFGDGALTDSVRPRDRLGRAEGRYHHRTPQWLSFDVRINDERRRLLVAKEPIMNNVSWHGIARAGAVTGTDEGLQFENRRYPQNAVVTDSQGNRYRVRLMQCGQSTLADFSEWNLLIGSVHEGDMDFSGERYGWIQRPYRDADLKVGYNGSLNWCQDLWRNGPDRVVRGYFFVSRLHATPPDFRGDRIYWRPVLELIRSDAPDTPPVLARSPDRRVSYYGAVSSAELFGQERRFRDQLPVENGVFIEQGNPDWLRFRYQGKTLLVAAKPIKDSLSWVDIARAGAVHGDGTRVRIEGRSYRQNAQVEDQQGNRYRVRLLNCGKHTLDNSSEWNALIGGVHWGDGDFLRSPDGQFGWLENPMTNADLQLGTNRGAASWCREVMDIHGRPHAVNRGYLTVARYHATDYTFRGYGFGWRPVLELIED